MLKKEIYPKTKRVSYSPELITITEKLDGSNLCIFKKDGLLHIAQRKTILSFNELEENKSLLYKGLYQWLLDNRDELETINDNSVVCGEWLGMGKLKYTVDEFTKRFYMFAKANINDDYKLDNIIYNHELFIYPFDNQTIPKCIGIVPVVTSLKYIPTVLDLNHIYDKYCEKVGRNVEGFVINYQNIIQKYVRMKNGKLEEHKA